MQPCDWLVAGNCHITPTNAIMELSQRAPPIFGRAAITLGIGPHSGFKFDLKDRVSQLKNKNNLDDNFITPDGRTN